jgi:hypothetical protein
MKAVIRILLLGFVVISICGCFKKVDFGFPKTVEFSNAGGEKIITGNESFSVASFLFGSDEMNSNEEEGTESRKSDWLKIEWKSPHSYELKITADPNKTGVKRELDIELHSCQDYQPIRIIQY